MTQPTLLSTDLPIAGLRADEPLRVIQISDCHLPADPATPYRGVNADAGLQAVLLAVSKWQPHIVLCSGDLSEDSSRDAYQRLKHTLAELKAPVVVLPGNHDDAAVMADYFPLGPWSGPLVLACGRWLLVILDSAIKGRVDGAISTSHLRQVSEFLTADPDRPVAVALHHQPIDAGSPWIDRYRLENQAELLDWVKHHPAVRCVTWGHVHQAGETMINDCRWLSAPSTAANSLPGQPRFTPDPGGPSSRWLELFPDGELRTGVLPAVSA